MNTRRSFITSLMLGGAASAAAQVRPPMFDTEPYQGKLKITKIDVVVTNPTQRPMQNYVLVRIETNEPGLYGWGDATITGTELAVKAMLEEHLIPALIGRDPMRIEDAWQTLYFLPYYRGGTAHMAAISGVDMALWDIKGKRAGMPVYDLLGGKARDRLMIYSSVGGRSYQEVEEGVRRLMERGYRVIKVQIAGEGQKTTYAVRPSDAKVLKDTEDSYAAGVPRVEVWEPGPYLETLPKLFDHLRNKLGEQIELLHDVHERVLPKDAVWLATALEPYRLFYFEDPLRPEHLDSFRLIRQQSGIAISMGEIFTGQWEALPLITEQLIDFIRCDVPHFGGVTAARKIATVCEPFQILTAWHGPHNISPISHMANAHVSLSVPNFGVQEYGPNWPEPIQEVFSGFPEFNDGYTTLNDTPGLGVDVNWELALQKPYKRFLRPMIRREDGTAWPY